METADKCCCLAWAEDRTQVEGLLLAGARIRSEYIKAGPDSYLAIVECGSQDGDYGARPQAWRFSINGKGSPHVYFDDEAEEAVQAFFAAVEPFADPVPAGPRSRPSGLSV